MSLPAMILAAGRGTRMMPLTADRPKPMIKVAGRALLDHALEAATGCDPVVVNTHYLADQIMDHLSRREVHVMHETPTLLDSGGGVRNALPVLGQGPFVTLNSDNVWKGPNPVQVLRSEWDAARMDALLLIVPMLHAVGRRGAGDFDLLPDGRVTPAKDGDVYSGAQILGRGLVGRWPEGAFSMWEIWREALAAGRLFGCLYPGQWADVGHPDGIRLAEDMLDV